MNKDTQIFPLALGMESDEDSAQIITAGGWHFARVEFYPVIENAQMIILLLNAAHKEGRTP